ncbi:isocitrate lyase/PEP mutase family protein [Sphingobium subterraneum]|uniref:Methylisocitrate lyase n=1 Tax=Sphingobium subterraneum TaxID=627688 RepID=A0A841J727_9SPHN|nr:isocitrate lyase/PEP mutase family protein [Sphingobium subterraneum]MBB6125336.1 methylisocitrate lyase [Sphingobium subterraneum]
MQMTAKLRAELAQGMVVGAGCFDALSARLAQLAGFRAIHMTGLGVEASQLGAPDLGLLSMTEVCTHAARMAEAVDIPILADIDTGFGGVLNVGRTIREMERAGIAGVHIEDQALPKHCPLLAGRTVVSREDAVDRLKAALDARTDPNFVIVARTDADTISFDEVVERANLFLAEGADMVMPMIMHVDGKSYFSLPPDEQLAWSRKLIGAIDGPVMNMGGSPPPGYTTDDLAEVGYAFTMYAASALSAAANAMADLFKSIRETGSDVSYFATQAGPYTNPLELMRAARLDHFVALETKYTAGLKSTT